MDITARQEKKMNYKVSESVVKKAFENAQHSDQREHFLVARLRESDSFIPELSLVAETYGKIVGHIMLTRLFIENHEDSFVSLALAPVSVLPEYQNKGIGSKLINEGLMIARSLGFSSVIVLGHEEYYPKFGFRPARTWGITAPFEVPDELFMALELDAGSLENVSGNVVYGPEFLE